MPTTAACRQSKKCHATVLLQKCTYLLCAICVDSMTSLMLLIGLKTILPSMLSVNAQCDLSVIDSMEPYKAPAQSFAQVIAFTCTCT
eukprot:m.57806 g.57806  ORF g.57806 m.57806 type:complete len:87 (+) comp11632_c0_seq3:617-877(+)